MPVLQKKKVWTELPNIISYNYDQKSWSHLTEWFWFKVPHEIVVQMSTHWSRLQVSEDLAGADRATLEVVHLTLGKRLMIIDRRQ